MNVLRRLLTGSHAQTEEHMSDHLDEELRGLARFRFVQHLRWCEGCSSMYECLRVTVGGLRQLRTEQPESDPAIAEAVLVRLRRESATPEGQ